MPSSSNNWIPLIITPPLHKFLIDIKRTHLPYSPLILSVEEEMKRNLSHQAFLENKKPQKKRRLESINGYHNKEEKQTKTKA